MTVESVQFKLANQVLMLLFAQFHTCIPAFVKFNLFLVVNFKLLCQYTLPIHCTLPVTLINTNGIALIPTFSAIS